MTTPLEKINETIRNYFIGTYEANETKIRLAFHSDVVISGYINGNHIEMDIDQFISKIQSQYHVDSPYEKQIHSIDIIGLIAHVKAKVLVGGDYFWDHINLVCIEGRWVIRNKLFTD